VGVKDRASATASVDSGLILFSTAPPAAACLDADRLAGEILVLVAYPDLDRDGPNLVLDPQVWAQTAPNEYTWPNAFAALLDS
jgi:hypothetical protein